ncbi:MAG: flagellar biosynthetic protein FliR [Ignavibacteriales bacterium]
MGFSFETFLLVFGRVTGLFLMAPIFSSRQIPITMRVFLVVMISGILAFVTPIKTVVPIDNSGYFVLALASEILVGYTLGFVTYAVFAGIQTAGQLIDMQMGFGIVNVMDPQSGTQIPLMGNFQYLVALMVFLGINGHHLMIKALHDSYVYIPVMGASFDGNFVQFIMNLAAYIFVIAVKLGAPVVTAIFMADMALGFIARTVPQMNVFIVGLPLKIWGGLFMVLVTMPIFVWFMQILMARFFNYLDAVIFLMGR